MVARSALTVRVDLEEAVARAAGVLNSIARTVSEAADELEASHYPDRDGRLCALCGAGDGSWPCIAGQVAQDLRRLLEEGQT